MRGELDWIVMKCLEKERSRRYETATDLARDIERYQHDEPVQACPPSAGYRFRKFARRHKVGLAGAVLVLFFLLLLGGGLGWIVRDRSGRHAEAALKASESLSRARCWIAENKPALAHRQELAEAKGRIGSDRAALGNLVDEIEALEAELTRFDRFLSLLDQAHEAEIPQVAKLAATATEEGMPPAPEPASQDRESARAVPFLLEALACYGVLDRDDWSAALERSCLEKGQTMEVERRVYEELLWLADDLARRRDHGAGRVLSAEQAAREALDYLDKAEGRSSSDLCVFCHSRTLPASPGRKAGGGQG